MACNLKSWNKCWKDTYIMYVYMGIYQCVGTNKWYLKGNFNEAVLQCPLACEAKESIKWKDPPFCLEN